MTPELAGDAGRAGAFRDGGLAAAAVALSLPLICADSSGAPGTLGVAGVLFGAGLGWSAAWRQARGTAPRPTAVSAGALAWLALSLVAAPGPASRGAIVALVAAAYGFAAAAAVLRRPAASSRPAPPAREVTEDALADPATGIGNSRAFVVSGAALVAETAAEGRPLALLAMDLDGYGALEARHGRAAAEALLVAFARLAHAYLPPTSLVCRLERDTFAAVLPKAEPDRARAVAEALRTLFAHLALESETGPVAGRVSIGIAAAQPGRSFAALLDAADRALLAAKDAGRDRVLHEADLGKAATPRRRGSPDDTWKPQPPSFAPAP